MTGGRSSPTAWPSRAWRGPWPRSATVRSPTCSSPTTRPPPRPRGSAPPAATSPPPRKNCWNGRCPRRSPTAPTRPWCARWSTPMPSCISCRGTWWRAATRRHAAASPARGTGCASRFASRWRPPTAPDRCLGCGDLSPPVREVSGLPAAAYPPVVPARGERPDQAAYEPERQHQLEEQPAAAGDDHRCEQREQHQRQYRRAVAVDDPWRPCPLGVRCRSGRHGLGLGQVCHHAAQVTEGLRAQRRGDSLVKFLLGEPALREVIAQLGGDAVPVGVGDTDPIVHRLSRLLLFVVLAGNVAGQDLVHPAPGAFQQLLGGMDLVGGAGVSHLHDAAAQLRGLDEQARYLPGLVLCHRLPRRACLLRVLLDVPAAGVGEAERAPAARLLGFDQALVQQGQDRGAHIAAAGLRPACRARRARPPGAPRPAEAARPTGPARAGWPLPGAFRPPEAPLPRSAAPARAMPARHPADGALDVTQQPGDGTEYLEETGIEVPGR